jgi:hypothetical protein
MKTSERLRARRLRRDEGRSVKEIAKLVGVSRSSVSLWVRDIPLTEEQTEALRRRNPVYDGQNKGARTNEARGRARRRAYQAEGRALARAGEALHLAGVMLYWAEGDKGEKHAARLANSDPQLLRFYVDFLRTSLGVLDERIRVTCNLFADHLEHQGEIEEFWITTLGLPRACLRRSIVNVYSKYSQKKRRNKLPYGTCKVAVHDTRVVQSIFGSIQEYGGFDRPEWLG